MEFINNKAYLCESIAPLHYYHINAKEYYKEILSLIKQYPNFHLLETNITNISESEAGAIVTTPRGSFSSTYVFNSLFNPKEIPSTYSQLKQHFLGWTVSFDKEVFEKDTMRLMDFRSSQKEKTNFVYILPSSSRTALVEFTVFSKELWSANDYQQALAQYLKEHYPNSSYRVTKTEYGVIPMTDYPFPQKEGRYQYRIGTSGGATKATTGYTFHNIQKRNRAIVSNLLQYGHPGQLSKRQKRFAFYDRLLLHIIDHEHHLLPHIFGKLFSNNAFRKVLRFLDEESTLREELGIFLQLPWAPFLRALWKTSAKAKKKISQPHTKIKKVELTT